MPTRTITVTLASGSLWILLLLTAAVMPVRPAVAYAASGELDVTPVIIDKNVKPQDILKESVSITNTSNRMLMLYPSINDENATSGEQSFAPAYNSAQAQQSLSNWIELSRGVIQLGPGEEKTVPFVVRVPKDALVGSYHALISFANGSTRAQAVAAGALGTVTVNVTLKADIKELLQLDSFSTDQFVFSGDDALFKYQVQNVGNQPLDPKGQIRIYNRRGEEVASVNVNNENKVISPQQVSQLASTWSAVHGFGRYKALLDVDYGTNKVASVQDTAYFWVIPWKEVLAVSFITLIGLILFAFYIERWFEDRHFAKLAAAGLLKAEAEIGIDDAPSRGSVPPEMVPAQPRQPDGAAENPRPASMGLRSWRKKREQPEAPVREGSRETPRSDLRSRMEEKPVREAPASDGTIDLKQTMPPAQAKEQVSEHHIINLKL